MSCDWDSGDGEPNNEDVKLEGDMDEEMGQTSEGAAPKKGRPKGKANAAGRKASARTSRAPWFCCPKAKNANSRWCHDHHPDAEAILYQARRDGEMDSAGRVMNDPIKSP